MCQSIHSLGIMSMGFPIWAEVNFEYVSLAILLFVLFPLAYFFILRPLQMAEDALRLDEVRLQALLDLNQMVHEPLNKVTDFALEQAVALTKSTIGYLAFVNDDETVLTMHAWSKGAMAECAIQNKPMLYPMATVGLWGEAVRQRRPIITNEYKAANPLKKGYPPGHVAIKRHLNIPVFEGQKIVAVAGVGNKKDPYDKQDVRQLTLLMQGMWRLLQRHQAEQALRESEQRFRAIFGTMFQFIGFMRPDGTVVDFNQAALDFAGITLKDVLYKPYWECHWWTISPQTQQRLREDIMRAAKGEFIRYPVKILGANGKTAVIDFSIKPVMAEDGRVTMLIPEGRDITEQKQAQDSLQESESRFRHMFESTTDGILIADVQTKKFVDANSAMCRQTGYSLHELLQMGMDQLHPASELKSVVEVFEKQTRRELTIAADVPVVRKDGTVFFADINSSPIMFNRRMCLLGMFRDITERKRAEEQRLAMERQLLHAQKLESLGVLAGGIAHDFNNLLMAVIGNLDTAYEDIVVSSPARVSLDHAMEASRCAVELTRQLLAYSGKGQFVSRHLNLSEMVDKNLHMLRSAIAKTATLHLELADGLAFVAGDPGQMHQVLMNLVSNASESLGGQPGTISIRTGSIECGEAYLRHSRILEKPIPGHFVYLDVIDSGCGMDDFTLSHLFEPFFTTKATGRGLGMSAVHGIVRKHKGAIVVDSQIGKGTQIRILFPSHAYSLDTRPRVLPTIQKIPLVFSGTALVVDDEERVRLVCQRMLKSLGFQVLTAVDGEDALVVFRQHADKILFVLLDLTMPRLDGVATFNALKQIKPDVKVILSSGYSQQESIQIFAGRGPTGFLQKPYDKQTLREELWRLLAAQEVESL